MKVVLAANNTLTLTVQSDSQPTFDVSIAYTGLGATTSLFLTYTPLGGGIQTLDFEWTPGTGQYNEAAGAIAQECSSGIEQCG